MNDKYPETTIQETLRRANHEATRSPYWVIIDPKQNLSLDINIAASQISGIFFSRMDAEEYLRAHHYNYSSRATVYCMSGHYSEKYNAFCDNLKAER